MEAKVSDFPEHGMGIGTPVGRSGNTRSELVAARLTVAAASAGVDDRARLLDMLGLVPDGKTLTVVVVP